jgi:hypothetical protein
MSTELTINAGLDRFRTGINNLLSDERIVAVDGVGLVLNEATEDDLGHAAQKLLAVAEINAAQRVLIDQYLGQLILTYSAMTNTSWSEAISNMNLTQDTGRAYKSLMKLPRMVSILPEEVFTIGLTSGHLEAATSFGGPKDPDKLGDFNQDRVAVLHDAAMCPKERNKSWVAERMRELQRRYGVAPSRAPMGDARKSYELCSQALIEWNDDDYETFGTTRGALYDRWRGYRDELIERGILSDNSSDPASFHLPDVRPGMGKILEAEVVDGSGD